MTSNPSNNSRTHGSKINTDVLNSSPWFEQERQWKRIAQSKLDSVVPTRKHRKTTRNRRKKRKNASPSKRNAAPTTHNNDSPNGDPDSNSSFANIRPTAPYVTNKRRKRGSPPASESTVPSPTSNSSPSNGSPRSSPEDGNQSPADSPVTLEERVAASNFVHNPATSNNAAGNDASLSPPTHSASFEHPALDTYADKESHFLAVRSSARLGPLTLDGPNQHLLDQFETARQDNDEREHRLLRIVPPSAGNRNCSVPNSTEGGRTAEAKAEGEGAHERQQPRKDYMSIQSLLN